MLSSRIHRGCERRIAEGRLELQLNGGRRKAAKALAALADHPIGLSSRRRASGHAVRRRESARVLVHTSSLLYIHVLLRGVSEGFLTVPFVRERMWRIHYNFLAKVKMYSIFFFFKGQNEANAVIEGLSILELRFRENVGTENFSIYSNVVNDGAAHDDC